MCAKTENFFFVSSMCVEPICAQDIDPKKYIFPPAGNNKIYKSTVYKYFCIIFAVELTKIFKSFN